ncbi:MAG TPA: hypothetical protein P5080_02875 [Candidatus Paceibacterota bacterium]|nr:hypothetical protein [Candidatus Pacearchaeota archaeon]HRZ50911.1 hypothetical protein [Candidatus Paceibacterota bacterium]HSA36632.1 hypothetical protein [Candidatus Paceibacterota bacterium]
MNQDQKMRKTISQFKKHNYLAIIPVIFALFFAMPAFCAEIYFNGEEREIKTNELFEAEVFINTGEESLNAVEGKIFFPRDLIEIKKINEGNSIINFWIEKPIDALQGPIAFSGIIPGGYNDSEGLILSMTFLAKKEGSGAIEVKDARALKNDGQGTEAPLKALNLPFSVSKEVLAKQSPAAEVKDSDLPETFRPEIARDKSMYDNKWLLVFTTQDKASGIDHYEIKESRRENFNFHELWVTAESPYVLKDQELRSFIFIKAVDKAGNARTEKIAPQNPLHWHEKYENLVLIVLGLAIVLLIKKILWVKRKKTA